MDIIMKIIGESIAELGVFGIILVGITKVIDLYKDFDLVGKSLIILTAIVIVTDNIRKEKYKMEALKDIKKHYTDKDM